MKLTNRVKIPLKRFLRSSKLSKQIKIPKIQLGFLQPWESNSKEQETKATQTQSQTEKDQTKKKYDSKQVVIAKK